MKHNQPTPGFKLWSPIPFPTRLVAWGCRRCQLHLCGGVKTSSQRGYLLAVGGDLKCSGLGSLRLRSPWPSNQSDHVPYNIILWPILNWTDGWTDPIQSFGWPCQTISFIWLSWPYFSNCSNTQPSFILKVLDGGGWAIFESIQLCANK